MRAVEVGAIVLTLIMLSTIAYADMKEVSFFEFNIVVSPLTSEMSPANDMLPTNGLDTYQYFHIQSNVDQAGKIFVAYKFTEELRKGSVLELNKTREVNEKYYDTGLVLRNQSFYDISWVAIPEPEVCELGAKGFNNTKYWNMTELYGNHTSYTTCVNKSGLINGTAIWSTWWEIGSIQKTRLVNQSYFDNMNDKIDKTYLENVFVDGINLTGWFYYANTPKAIDPYDHAEWRISYKPALNDTTKLWMLYVWACHPPEDDNPNCLYNDDARIFFYEVDPYWNVSKTNRTPLFVNNIDSIDHFNEPLIYNLSGICNDVAPAVVYNNSGTLDFYPFYNISGNANWSVSQYVAPTPNSVYLRVLVNSTTGTGVWNWGEIYCGGTATTQPPFVIFSDNFTDNRNGWVFGPATDTMPPFINTTDGRLWMVSNKGTSYPWALQNVSSQNGTVTFRATNLTDSGPGTRAMAAQIATGTSAATGSGGYNSSTFYLWGAPNAWYAQNSSVVQYSGAGIAPLVLIDTDFLMNYSKVQFYRFGSDGSNLSAWNATDALPHLSSDAGIGYPLPPWSWYTYAGFRGLGASDGTDAYRLSGIIDDFAFVWSGVTNDIYARTYNITAAGGIGTTDTSALDTFIIYPANLTVNSTSRNFTITANSTNNSYTCNYTRNGVTNTTNFTVLNNTSYSVDWSLPFAPYVLSTTCSNGSETSTTNVTFVVRQLVGWVNTSAGTTVVQSTTNTTNCTANIFGSPLWVNFTISNSTDIVVDNVNGTIYADGNWSSINFTPYYIGIYYCNISVYDGYDTITNYTSFSVVGATAPNITEITTNRGLSFDILTENTTYCMVNVTDADGNDTIQWVNFTVTNPASIDVFTMINGTNISMTTWISKNFTAGLAGAWTCTVKAYDGVSQPLNSKGFTVTTPGGGGATGGGGGAPITVYINETAAKKNVTVTYPVPKLDLKQYIGASGPLYDFLAWIQKNGFIPVVLGAIIFLFVSEPAGIVVVLYGVGVIFGAIGVTL